MRTPEAQIKAAILHPDAEVREVATSYFTVARSADPSIMKLVIESVEKYGREHAFYLLRTADELAQTPATLRWLMDELSRSYDVDEVGQDNYRCAVAFILCKVAPRLLVPLEAEILGLPAFPRQLRDDLSLQVERASWDWPTGWQALQAWGKTVEETRKVTLWDSGQAVAIIRALGQFRDQGAETVLRLLYRHYRGYAKGVMQCLEPQLVALAGEMQLHAAIPILIERLYEDDDVVADEVGSALAKIGTQQALDAVAEGWPEGHVMYRLRVSEVLECIHCDLSVEMARKFLADEQDLTVACALGNVLLHHFAEDGIELVRDLVLAHGAEEEEDVRSIDELRWRLVAAATIMAQPFPEYEAWRQEALERRWGMGKIGAYRFVDNLGPDAKGCEWESAEEVEDGALKSKLGTILLRGGNILFVSPV